MFIQDEALEHAVNGSIKVANLCVAFLSNILTVDEKEGRNRLNVILCSV